MINAVGYAAKHSFSRLERFEFQREDATAEEVEIEVMFCGVCHSDIHQVKNEWHTTVYPCLPGHEVVGNVTRAGSAVTKHKVGDMVGVGCMVDSCRQCAPCLAGEENYCEGANSWLATYNGPMVPKEMAAGLRREVAAPILCAGVTTYSPMKHWGVKAGSVVGVIGTGGLGHLAAKIAKALGADVTVFTTTKEKLEEAQRLGVKGVMENDKDALKALKMHFDFMMKPKRANPSQETCQIALSGKHTAGAALAETSCRNFRCRGDVSTRVERCTPVLLVGRRGRTLRGRTLRGRA